MADPTPSQNAAEPNTSPNAVPTQAGQAYEATIAGAASEPQTAASSSTATLAVGTRLDTYELLEKLGEGGMGTVWKAKHLKLDKLVALKVLPEHLTNDPETVRRFEREMRAVAIVEHPHVVRAMDARELGRLHFLVMEYVEGVDLSKYVKLRGPRSVPDACVMLRHAALGLAAAHAQGLIHRDIKPSNLLLSKQGQVKVLDLGLARLMAEGHEPRQLTQSGQVLGTPDFMAPEQWDDTHAVDHRADLYALGCTLCFLLTGRAPFGDERHSTMGQKMKGHLLEAPPHLRDLRPDVPQELEDLYSRLMMKEPAQRLASAADVANRLKEIAQGLPTKTVPVGETSKIMDSGTAVQDATAQPAAVSPTMTFAPEKSTHDSLESTAKRTELARPLPLRSSTPPPPPRNRWTLAAAGAAALLLLGVIVITITNKDGTKSTIRVPEGTDADVVAAPGSKVTIRQENDRTASSPTTSTGNSGWHGWPADAPKPAIAPFDADQAKKHQEEWAVYLKVPVEYTNSIGMEFRKSWSDSVDFGPPPVVRAAGV